jgi:hypothetical protein
MRFVHARAGREQRLRHRQVALHGRAADDGRQIFRPHVRIGSGAEQRGRFFTAPTSGLQNT